jgi:hypothetical protein
MARRTRVPGDPASVAARLAASRRAILLRKMAERTGFEHVVEFYPYGGLANRWFQPLTHLSAGPVMLARHA